MWALSHIGKQVLRRHLSCCKNFSIVFPNLFPPLSPFPFFVDSLLHYFLPSLFIPSLFPLSLFPFFVVSFLHCFLPHYFLPHYFLLHCFLPSLFISFIVSCPYYFFPSLFLPSFCLPSYLLTFLYIRLIREKIVSRHTATQPLDMERVNYKKEMKTK